MMKAVIQQIQYCTVQTTHQIEFNDDTVLGLVTHCLVKLMLQALTIFF